MSLEELQSRVWKYYKNLRAQVDECDLDLFHWSLDDLLQQSRTVISLWLQTVKISRAEQRQSPPPYVTRDISTYFDSAVGSDEEADEDEPGFDHSNESNNKGSKGAWTWSRSDTDTHSSSGEDSSDLSLFLSPDLSLETQQVLGPPAHSS